MSGQMNNIAKARKLQNLTQDQVAKALGISRPSYINIENGKKDLSLREARCLSSILRISLDDIMNISDEGATISLQSGKNEKYKQMILNSIQYGADTSDGKIPKTKLAKLVYLADFIWYYFTNKPMSGMTYRKYSQGPVPDTYFRVVDELEIEQAVNCEIKNTAHMYSLVEKNAPKNKLSKKELYLIKAICSAWKDKATQEIVDFTHDQLPWQICRPNEIIPYDLITQEEPNRVLGSIKLPSDF